MTTALTIEGLSIALPPGGQRRLAVDGVSLAVAKGEILCVVGESGSGKSITAYSVLGLLPKSLRVAAGSVLFDGQDLTRLSENDMRRVRGRRIGMIFQEPMTALNPVWPVGDQIEEVFLAHTDLGAAERRARVLALLRDVHLDDHERILRAYPHQLSGGQRQRVMIAMALALEPELLLADEPTTALDVTTQAQILRLVRELQAQHGTGVLFITHDFGVVAEIADRVAVMQDGRVVETDERDRVLDAPQHPYTKALLAAVPGLTPRHRAQQADRPTLLTVEGLRKSYALPASIARGKRTTQALAATSLTIASGETLGVVGESGSGKTTLARCIVRLIDPDAGRVELDGVEFSALRGRALRRQRKDIQFVFQDPYGSLNPRKTVGDIIAQGPVNYGARRADALARARELLALVAVDPDAVGRYPNEFSGGQRQRICIARALALEPKLLVADEAVSALDVSVQAQIIALLDDIRDRLGLTLLFITHDLRVAAQVCDRVVVMQAGEVVEAGTAGEVFERATHPYTQALLAAIPGQQWQRDAAAKALPAT